MSKVPKPLMPGVSITAPPAGQTLSGSAYISEKVVVCMPVR